MRAPPLIRRRALGSEDTEMRRITIRKHYRTAILAGALTVLVGFVGRRVSADDAPKNNVTANATNLVLQGQQIFRFDTFGDEAFWGDMLNLHLAIEGSQHGGQGPGLSPNAALMAGL